MELVSKNGAPVMSEQDAWDKQRIADIARNAHHNACILYGIAARSEKNVAQWNNVLQAASDLAHAMAELKEVV